MEWNGLAGLDSQCKPLAKAASDLGLQFLLMSLILTAHGMFVVA